MLLLGLIAGTVAEQSHLRSLADRERAAAGLPVTSFRTPPAEAARGRLFTAEVTLSADYMRSYLSTLRKLIGGRLRGLDRLAARARREAILRLKEQAAEAGCAGLCGLRVESVDIGRSLRRKHVVAMITEIASATGYSLPKTATRAGGPGSPGGQGA
jgi:uncharacterized protein YbjQ (UPF0145 family)